MRPLAAVCGLRGGGGCDGINRIGCCLMAADYDCGGLRLRELISFGSKLGRCRQMASDS